MNALLKKLKEQYTTKDEVDKELLQEIFQKDFESVLIGFKEDLQSNKSSYSVTSHAQINM